MCKDKESRSQSSKDWKTNNAECEELKSLRDKMAAFESEENKAIKAKKLKEQQEDKIKRSVIRGDSADELIKNIQSVDWDKVAEEVRPRAGGKIDFGV